MQSKYCFLTWKIYITSGKHTPQKAVIAYLPFIPPTKWRESILVPNIWINLPQKKRKKEKRKNKKKIKFFNMENLHKSRKTKTQQKAIIT